MENPRTSQTTENRNRGIKERQVQRSERRAHCSSMYSCCSGGGQGAKRWPQHEGQRREKPWSEEECGQALGKVWRLLLSRAGRARPPGHEEEGGAEGERGAGFLCVLVTTRLLTRAAARSPGWPASGTSRPRWGSRWSPGAAAPCHLETRRRCAAGAAVSRRREGQAAMPAEGGATTTGKEAPGTRRRSGAGAPASVASAAAEAPASAAPSRKAAAGQARQLHREDRVMRLRKARGAGRG